MNGFVFPLRGVRPFLVWLRPHRPPETGEGDHAQHGGWGKGRVAAKQSGICGRERRSRWLCRFSRQVLCLTTTRP